MTNDLERRFAEINSGRMAAHVLDHMRPLFEALRAQHLSTLKQDHRAGKFDPARAQAAIASLCDLDDLEAKLNRQVARGQQATSTHQGEINETQRDS